MIKVEKWQQLRERMAALNLLEADLEEQFIAGSGKGGQKINKTASCVRLTHAVSGLKIKCQQSRSREDNRFFARRLLCEQLENQKQGKLSIRQLKQKKIRQQKKRRYSRSRSRIDLNKDE